jgi:hypothetical protein
MPTSTFTHRIGGTNNDETKRLSGKLIAESGEVTYLRRLIEFSVLLLIEIGYSCMGASFYHYFFWGEVLKKNTQEIHSQRRA